VLTRNREDPEAEDVPPQNPRREADRVPHGVHAEVLRDHVAEHDHAREKPSQEARPDTETWPREKPRRDEPSEDARAAAAERHEDARDRKRARRVQVTHRREERIDDLAHGLWRRAANEGRKERREPDQDGEDAQEPLEAMRAI